MNTANPVLAKKIKSKSTSIDLAIKVVNSLRTTEEDAASFESIYRKYKNKNFNFTGR